MQGHSGDPRSAAPARDIESYARYAIYWAPPAGSALGAAGARWLGWDAEARVASVPLGGALVARPRRYGFHATLKAPFRLSPGASATDLDVALAALAGRSRPATGPALTLDTDHGVALLRPEAPCPEIDALAAACVTGLDAFRAPPTEDDLARRRAEGIDATGEALLARWGYPHVLERFRFHVTLSGPLADAEVPGLAELAERHVVPHLDQLCRIDEVSLFGDPGDGAPLELIRRHRLGKE
jgi:hypothetical protein